jgi:hypothetical protein
MSLLPACDDYGIDSATCGTATGGVSKLWFTDCNNVDSLTFDADHNITAITMDVGASNPVFHLIVPEPDTAFFTQEKTRNDAGGLSVSQVLNWNHYGLSNAVKNKLAALNNCCCLHGIALTNEGFFKYFGINYNYVNASYTDRFFRTGAGNANSGQNPATDGAGFLESVEGTSNFYALEFSGTEADIPV